MNRASKQRQYVKKRTTVIFGDSVSYNIDEFINIAYEWKERGCTSIMFETEYESYDIRVHVVQERLETDEEYKKRIDIDEANKKAANLRKKAIKEKKDKEDFALYEKLKKKFDSNENI
jgi:MoaA/NifB/PqqE/SkfB family radical SAM enzyme